MNQHTTPQPLTAPSDIFQQFIAANLNHWHAEVVVNEASQETLDQNYEQIVKSLVYAMHSKQAKPAVNELIEAVAPYMERTGQWAEWEYALNQTLQVAQNTDDIGLTGRIFALKGRLSRRQNRSNDMIIYYRQAIRLSRQVGDSYNEARACTNLGFYYVDRRFLYRAKVLCCYAKSLFQQIDNAYGVAHTDNNLGLICIQQRDWDKAQKHFESANDIWQKMNNDYAQMDIYINLGLLNLYRKQPSGVLAYTEKALQKAEVVGEALILGVIHQNMGAGYWLQKDFDRAEHFIRTAEQIFQELSYLPGLAQAWESLGIIALDYDKVDSAYQHLTKALNAWQELDNRSYEARTLVHLIEYYLLTEKHTKALKCLNKVEELRDDLMKIPDCLEYEEKLLLCRRRLTVK